MVARPKDLFRGSPIAVASIAGELCTFSMGLSSVRSDSASNGNNPGVVCLAKAESKGDDDSDGIRVRSRLDKARWIVPEGRPSSSLSGLTGTVFKSARLQSPPLVLSLNVLATAVTRDVLLPAVGDALLDGFTGEASCVVCIRWLQLCGDLCVTAVIDLSRFSEPMPPVLDILRGTGIG